MFLFAAGCQRFPLREYDSRQDSIVDMKVIDNPSPCIDLLYDYAPFLRSSEAAGGIGYFTGNVPRPRVGIVGAGISGLVAAAELLRVGVTDIVLFEARNRIGGRAWSQMFDPHYPHLIAEMGAMRFPPSATCLFII